MRERFNALLSVLSRPLVAIGGALGIGVLVVGGTWYVASRPHTNSTVPVTQGSITQEVDVSGTVKAARSTDLSFQTSGRIAAIRVAVGSHVSIGQTLAVLDSSTQAAAVALARANVESQQARLASLTAGTRPEQLAINTTAVTQAEQALTSTIQTAYTNADDAVHAKADQLFTNPRNTNAQLTIVVPDAVLTRRIQTERVALESLFTSWQLELAGSDNPQAQAIVATNNLKTISAFLNDLMTALAETQPSSALSATALSGYQSSVNVGRLNVAGARSAIISAETGFTAANGALALANAGATANDIAAQTAVVDAAKASLAAAQANASQAVITAPISGTITVQNANLGQTVVPGAPLIGMMADGKYEADAQVSETDIAKVHVHDVANVTFASYPGVTFAALVTTINPAAQTINGVASYGITITFTKDDSRLMPGLSANIRIVTATKDTVLLVPTSTILVNGTQQFVYVEQGTNSTQTPITTGIVSANGTTEVLSGLTLGEQIRTFAGTTTL